jgi:hypothetical protein
MSFESGPRPHEHQSEREITRKIEELLNRRLELKQEEARKQAEAENSDDFDYDVFQGISNGLSKIQHKMWPLYEKLIAAHQPIELIPARPGDQDVLVILPDGRGIRRLLSSGDEDHELLDADEQYLAADYEVCSAKEVQKCLEKLANDLNAQIQALNKRAEAVARARQK